MFVFHGVDNETQRVAALCILSGRVSKQSLQNRDGVRRCGLVQWHIAGANTHEREQYPAVLPFRRTGIHLRLPGVSKGKGQERERERWSAKQSSCSV